MIQFVPIAIGLGAAFISKKIIDSAKKPAENKNSQDENPASNSDKLDHEESLNEQNDTDHPGGGRDGDRAGRDRSETTSEALPQHSVKGGDDEIPQNPESDEGGSSGNSGDSGGSDTGANPEHDDPGNTAGPEQPGKPESDEVTK